MGGSIARYAAAGTEVDRVTAAETMFANFTAKSNLAKTDDSSKMVGKMFPHSDIAKKFSAERTTTTQIIKGALAPNFNQVSFLYLLL